MHACQVIQRMLGSEERAGSNGEDTKSLRRRLTTRKRLFSSWFFRRTRNLVLVATLLVGLQELSVILIALSSNSGLSGDAGSFAVYIGFGSFFGVLLLSTVLQNLEVNLRERTPSPPLAWLYLHTLYWLPSAINGVILYLGVLYVLAGKNVLPGWPLLLAFWVIVSWFYDYLLLQGVGQGYQNFRGASWAGAAAFAKLAHGMFQKKRRTGLSPLLKSLTMTQSLFSLRRYAPEDLDAVYSTVVALSETPSINFESLLVLTRTLATLPRIDELPLALSQFLRDTKWPGMFKHVPFKRTSSSQRAVVFLGALTALSTFLAALPDDQRRSFFGTGGSFLISNLIPILATLGIVFATFATLYAVVYSVPIGYVRRFWPKNFPASDDGDSLGANYHAYGLGKLTD